MVLRILKSNQPVNFIIFPLIGIAIWLKSVLSPKVYPYFLSENENILFLPIYKMLQNMPVLQVVTAFVLVILIGFLIQRINSSYSFIKTRTMLPAPLIILIISGFTAMQTLHPVYFAALFLLLAIHRFFSIFDKTKPFSALFDTGLLIGIGSLFYFNLILKSISVLTKNDFTKMIIKKAIIGEISMPKRKPKGKIFFIAYRMGSVVLYKNCTIGLYGSGLTQLIIARIKINQ